MNSPPLSFDNHHHYHPRHHHHHQEQEQEQEQEQPQHVHRAKPKQTTHDKMSSKFKTTKQCPIISSYNFAISHPIDLCGVLRSSLLFDRYLLSPGDHQDDGSPRNDCATSSKSMGLQTEINVKFNE